MVSRQPNESKQQCHLITNKQSCINLKIGNIKIENRAYKKLLRVKVDNKLNFNEHLDRISKIFPFINLSKRSYLMNSFFTSQFSSCLLTWMCHTRTVNNKINKLYERYLRIVFNNKKSSFKEIFETDETVLIHITNLQVPATEMFKEGLQKYVSP